MIQQEAAEKYAETYRCPATNENEYCKHDIISAFNNGAKWQKQISDNYAIEVLEYYHNGLFFIPLKDGEAKKILEHIKKEKGL